MLHVEVVAGQRIRAEEPRGPALIALAFVVAVSAGWEWLWLGMPADVASALAYLNAPAGDGPPRELVYLMLALPLLALPVIARDARIALFGQVVVVDGLARQITRNGRPVAKFADVESLELRPGYGDLELRVHLRNAAVLPVGPICPERDRSSIRQRIVEIVGTRIPLREEPRRRGTRSWGLLAAYRVLRIAQYGLLLGAAGSFAVSAGYVLVGASAAGVVVERVEQGGTGEGDFGVVCTIEFVGPEGRRIRFETATGTTDTRIGDRVPVVYFAAAPSWARVDDFDHHWNLPALLLLVGIFLFPFNWIFKLVGAIGAFAAKR